MKNQENINVNKIDLFRGKSCSASSFAHPSITRRPADGANLIPDKESDLHDGLLERALGHSEEKSAMKGVRYRRG